MGNEMSIGVLISGGGSNLQAILDACNTGKINGKVVVIGSDNPKAKGLEKGLSYDIPVFAVDYGKIINRINKEYDKTILPDDFDLNDTMSKQGLFSPDMNMEKIKQFLASRAVAEAGMLDQIKKYPLDLLVLAGFMRNLTPYFIDSVHALFGDYCIMNIHPALLPAFPGLDGYGDTFRYGCKIGGCTVHFVDYGEDSGPIIGQKVYKILENDTIETIREKGLKLEWELYTQCIQLFVQRRLKPVDMTYTLKNGKKVLRTVVKILP